MDKDSQEHWSCAVIGNVSLIQYQATVFDLGHWIGAPLARRRFTSAALDAVIQQAISHRQAAEVWAVIKHVNTPGIRITTRLVLKLAREQDTHLSYCLNVL